MSLLKKLSASQVPSRTVIGGVLGMPRLTKTKAKAALANKDLLVGHYYKGIKTGNLFFIRGKNADGSLGSLDKLDATTGIWNASKGWDPAADKSAGVVAVSKDTIQNQFWHPLDGGPKPTIPKKANVAIRTTPVLVIEENKKSKKCIKCGGNNKEVFLAIPGSSTFYCPKCED